MRISDILGGNSLTATVEMLCASKGITIPDYEQEQIAKMRKEGKAFFVFIGSSYVNIMPMRERSERLGRVVYGGINSGTVLFFHDGGMREITRENWGNTWKMITPKVAVELDDRISVPKRERTSFDDAMPRRNPPKPSRKGFQRTYDSNTSMSLLAAI